MSLTRRNFLKLGVLTTAAGSISGCSVLGRRLAQNDLPASLSIPTPLPNAAGDTAVDSIYRLLNRAGYGHRPGDHEAVAEVGYETYLEQQLNPDEIDDSTADLIVNNLSFYRMDISQLINQDEKDVMRELGWMTLAKKLYSKRQLYEAMVEFWSDHFNIYIRKNMFMPPLKLADDRDVIRPHALGRFRDLLYASAYSPAMLNYLDNARNFKDAPNENYARELMELHTMGVHAGYTQQDVAEAARVLTGLGIERRGLRQGTTVFRPQRHDEGVKTVLGQPFTSNQGEKDIEQLLEMLLAQPATADFIATKLVRRFVADEPPPALVAQVSQTFKETDGDIKQMLRDIFLSEEFKSGPFKLKRPFTFMISALRALQGDAGRIQPLLNWLRLLGQVPFMWPAPNGYPDTAPAWTANLLTRWNFALTLTQGEIGGTSVPLAKMLEVAGAANTTDALNLFAALILARPLDAEAHALFTDYVGSDDLTAPQTQQRLADSAALMLASPAFQWT